MSAQKKKSLLHVLKQAILPHRHNQYRPYITRIPGLFLTVVVLILLQLLSASISYGFLDDSILNTDTSGMYTKTNQVRSENDVPDLSYSPKLEQAAQNKLADMEEKNYWSHKAPDGSYVWDYVLKESYIYEFAGENLSRGFETDSEIVSAWLNSPEHRKNMLNTNFTEAGFASKRIRLNNRSQVVAVGLYAKPLPSGSVVSNGEITALQTNAEANELLGLPKDIQINLSNPILSTHALSLPGEIAAYILIGLLVIYLLQHILLHYKNFSWQKRWHEIPLFRIVVISILLIALLATSNGSVG